MIPSAPNASPAPSSPLREDQRAAVALVGRTLWRSGLAELLALLLRGSEFERNQALIDDLPLVPDALGVLVRLLVLSQPVPVAAIEDPFPGLLEALGTLGLCGVEDGTATASARLAYHFGVLVFCERMNPAIRLYHGDDSIGLGRVLLGARGRVLDLCAGVGTQGILCARGATAVVSVEIQPGAAFLYHVNAELNGVSDRMDLRTGDFVDAVDGQFDVICCNPPLLPVPPRVPYPLVGDGGPDGLAFATRLLRALPRLLAPGGRCHLVGTTLGGPLGPDLRPFEALALDGHLDLSLVVPSGQPMRAGAPFLEALVQSVSLYANLGIEPVRRAFVRHFQPLHRNKLYTFVLTARHAEGPTGTVQITRHYTRNRTLWAV